MGQPRMSSLLAKSSEFAMTGFGGWMKAMIRSELSHCGAAGPEWLVGWFKLRRGEYLILNSRPVPCSTFISGIVCTTVLQHSLSYILQQSLSYNGKVCRMGQCIVLQQCPSFSFNNFGWIKPACAWRYLQWDHRYLKLTNCPTLLIKTISWKCQFIFWGQIRNVIDVVKILFRYRCMIQIWIFDSYFV